MNDIAELRKRLVNRQLELTRRIERAYLTMTALQLSCGDGRFFCLGRIEEINEILEWLDES